MLLLLVAACTAPRETTPEGKPPPQRSERQSKAPLEVYEATLNPSDFDEEIDAVRTAHAEAASRPPLEIPGDSSYVEEEVVQGFRIQIFSSASIDEGNAAKLAAMEAFPTDSVYVVYDPPVYKVRLGDFVSRLEANRRLAQVIQSRYPDAWVVADRVVQRRVVRVLTSPDSTPKP